MTTKSKPKKAERPKVKKETVKDLGAKDGEKVRGGAQPTGISCARCSL